MDLLVAVRDLFGLEDMAEGRVQRSRRDDARKRA